MKKRATKGKAFTFAIGAMLMAALPAAFAATRIDELAVRPNPAAFVDGVPPPVEITVTVSRGQFDKQPCDVIVDTGDGAAVTKLAFGLGDERTQRLRHTYRKPGAYQLKALAGSGCTGTRTVAVTVLATPAAAPSPAAGANAPAEPGASVNAPAASVNAPAEPGCPAGWWLVPESVQGASYSCRPNLPARPLTCAGGTRYFSENGAIGCR